MREAILAILYHLVQAPDKDIPLTQQHMYCPKDSSSWCRFWVDQDKNTHTYSESQRLPSAFFSVLEPIFKRFSDPILLRRCQLGSTQNPNERFNSTIWMRCLKASFCGLVCITAAESEAVCIFTSGASAYVSLWASAGIKSSSRQSLLALHRQNTRRIKSASQKITDKYRSLRWQKSKSFLKQKEETRRHYASGAFDHTGEAIASSSSFVIFSYEWRYFGF